MEHFILQMHLSPDANGQDREGSNMLIYVVLISLKLFGSLKNFRGTENKQDPQEARGLFDAGPQHKFYTSLFIGLMPIDARWLVLGLMFYLVL